ncbi:MAG: PE domain-containing protein [Pseudonocardiaceae bacterium]|nr:MAG: PE domain-containing protein [Pseudonocardiaceae bacterium]
MSSMDSTLAGSGEPGSAAGPTRGNRPAQSTRALTIPIMLSNVPARFADHAAGMAIDRDNVLQVAQILRGEAARLRDAVNDLDDAKAGLCGGDPVSEEAAAAFNQRSSLLQASFRQYVDDLQALADSVLASARSYGVTDADNAATLR